jgi:hypothetical protein
MNSVLQKYYDAQLKVNKHIVNGWATYEMRDNHMYIDKVFKGSVRSANKRFKYESIEPLSELDEFFYRRGKTVDIHRTDTTMYRIHTTFDSEPIPNIYTALPFVRQASRFQKSGTFNVVTPVLSDNVITPGRNNIFMKLLGIKQFFYNIKRSIYINKEDVTSTIVYSNALSSSVERSDDKTIGKIHCPATFFMLSKYGLRTLCEKYCGTNDVIMMDTPDNYSKYLKRYDVYTSIRRTPAEVRGKQEVEHDICIMVSKEAKNKNFLTNLISGIFYGFDIFSAEAFTIAKAFELNNENEETKAWTVLTGRLAYKDSYSVGHAFNLIKNRLIQVESYLDIISKERLSNVGVETEDFYDGIFHITDKYDEYMVTYKDNKNRNFDRYIEVNYYILFPFIVGINRMIHDINNSCDKKSPNISNITKIIHAKLNTKTIYGISAGGKTNIALSPIDSTNDSMFTKMTGLLELQERGNTVFKEPNNQFPYSARRLDASDCAIGTMDHLRKNAPTGKLNINPFSRWDLVTGKALFTEEERYTLDVLDMMFSGRIVSDEISDGILEAEDIKL